MCGSHRRHHASRYIHEVERPRPRDDAAIRASDEERERVATALRDHAAAGRLDVTELEQRLETAYRARTRGELSALTADLPRARRAQRPRTDDVWMHARTWLSVCALLVVIWALTGGGYFWPIWPFLGWGIGIVSHASKRRPGARAYPG